MFLPENWVSHELIRNAISCITSVSGGGYSSVSTALTAFGCHWVLQVGYHMKNSELSFYTPHKRSLGRYIGITLSVRLSVQSKLNLNHNILTKGYRALILHKCIPCDKTFPSIPKLLTSWPWLLTYFWKNITLAITFEPKVIGLSYLTCVFLVARPFCWKQNLLPRDLDLDFWLTFEKT